MMRRGLLLAFWFLVTLTMSAQWSFQEEGSGIPAYNANPPKPGTKLPPILGKEQLWGQNAQYPFQSHAYELAAKIPVVLPRRLATATSTPWVPTACTAVFHI